MGKPPVKNPSASWQAPAPPSPNTNGHLLDFWGGPIACQDAEGFFTGGFPNTYIYTTLMVKFGGEIGTLYQMLKNAFKKPPLQNRKNVQKKGGGGQRPFLSI